MNGKMNLVQQYLHRQTAMQAEAQLNQINEAMVQCIGIGAHSAVRRLAMRMKALTRDRETPKANTISSDRKQIL